MPTRAAKWRIAKTSTIGVSQRDPVAPTTGGNTRSATAVAVRPVRTRRNEAARRDPRYMTVGSPVRVRRDRSSPPDRRRTIAARRRRSSTDDDAVAGVAAGGGREAKPAGAPRNRNDRLAGGGRSSREAASSIVLRLF